MPFAQLSLKERLEWLEGWTNRRLPEHVAVPRLWTEPARQGYIAALEDEQSRVSA